MATSSIWYSQRKSEGKKTPGRCVTLEYTVDTLDINVDLNNKMSCCTAPLSYEYLVSYEHLR